MSRIGRQPVSIPSGVEVKQDGNIIVFKKDKNELKLDTRGLVKVEIKKEQILFSPRSDSMEDSAYWGLYRSLANNAIIGLTKGFKKQLEVNGVGYRAAIKGNILELQLGFSHLVNFDIPKELKISVEKNIITIEGIDKQVVGQVAAKIRGIRPPEPYKGKGVKYLDEKIIRKAGKTAKK